MSRTPSHALRFCHAADGRRGRWSLVGWMFNPTEQPWLLGTGSTSARPDPMPRLRAADPPGLRHLGRPRRRRAPHPTPPAAAAPANLTARTRRSSLGPPHGHLGRAVGRPDDNQAEPRGQHRRQAALQPVRDLVFGLMQPGAPVPCRLGRPGPGLQLPPPHRVALDGKPRDRRTDSGFSCPRWNGQHARCPGHLVVTIAWGNWAAIRARDPSLIFP
jgi:hypothetical protein